MREKPRTFMDEELTYEIDFNIHEPLLERLQGRLILTTLLVKDINNSRELDFPKHLIKRIKERLGHYTPDSLKNDPVVRAYRDFYWKTCKIDPTKIRPAGEALARRVLLGKTMPNVSLVVNAYNAASAMTRIAISAYDFNLLDFPLTVRNAKTNEVFHGIGKNKPISLTQEHLVLADEISPVNIIPYRDAERTKITHLTRNVLLIAYGVNGIPKETLEDAVMLAGNLIIEETKQGELGEIVHFSFPATP